MGINRWYCARWDAIKLEADYRAYRKTLKRGDFVVMHTCAESVLDKYAGKILKCGSDEFDMCGQKMIWLEGVSGAFCAEYLVKVDVASATYCTGCNDEIRNFVSAGHRSRELPMEIQKKLFKNHSKLLGELEAGNKVVIIRKGGLDEKGYAFELPKTELEGEIEKIIHITESAAEDRQKWYHLHELLLDDVVMEIWIR